VDFRNVGERSTSKNIEENGKDELGWTIRNWEEIEEFVQGVVFILVLEGKGFRKEC
jgi:hypothetical protein